DRGSRRRNTGVSLHVSPEATRPPGAHLVPVSVWPSSVPSQRDTVAGWTYDPHRGRVPRSPLSSPHPSPEGSTRESNPHRRGRGTYRVVHPQGPVRPLVHHDLRRH